MKTVDVVVVGAGFAGLACATALAHRGFEVVVLERKRSAGQAMHTTGILVKEAAAELEVPSTLVRRVAGIRLYSPGLRRAVDLRSDDYFFLATDTPGLMRYFSQRAQDAGVEVRFGQPFRPDRPPGEAPVEDVGTVALPHHALRCRWLIGADGPRSAVARSFGLGRNRAFLAGVEAELDGVSLGEPEAFHCFLTRELAPGYLGWAVPSVGIVQVGLAARLPRRPDIDAFLRRIAAVVDLRDARIVDRRGGLIPVGGLVRPFARGRVLLLGDAAGTVSPLTAGGIHTALHYGDVLADAIDGFEHRGRPQPGAILASSYPRFRFKRGLRLALEHLAHDWAVDLVTESAPFAALARSVFFRKKRLAGKSW